MARYWCQRLKTSSEFFALLEEAESLRGEVFSFPCNSATDSKEDVSSPLADKVRRETERKVELIIGELKQGNELMAPGEKASRRT